MIENFMVEASRAVADQCKWSVLPVLLGEHDEPASKSGERLADRLDMPGIPPPGGSIRDQEVIDAVNEHVMAMVFTATLHFRH